MHLGATAGRCRVSGHLRMRMIFDGARRTLRWQRHTPEGGCRLMKGCIQACTARCGRISMLGCPVQAATVGVLPVRIGYADLRAMGNVVRRS